VSKKVIDAIIEEAYGTVVKKKINKIARQRVDSSGLHFISITQQDIFDLIVYNYVAIKRPRMVSAERKRLKDSESEDTSRAAAAKNVVESDSKLASSLRREAETVSKKIFNQFVENYNNNEKEESYRAFQVGQQIQLFQPSNKADRVKKVIVDLLETASIGTILNTLTTGKAKKSFTRRTQFLHVGKTVGGQIVEDLASSATKIKFDNTSKAAAIKVLENMMKEVTFDWSTSDFYDGRTISVVGKIGQTLANKPGQESTDWKAIRPKLEAELLKELDKRGSKFATKEGSQPFIERAAKKVANATIETAIKSKNITGTPFKVDKPKNKKSKNLRSASKPKKVTPGKASFNRKKLQEKDFQPKQMDQGAGLLELQVLLNAKLPDVVRKNMTYPSLINRTGKFSSSVKVTDIVRTPKGFPSVGYTYEKNPYQIFELGAGKTPWASGDRDPRALIDKSIREIAAELAIGRFFTRRV
jgi:hypothetical protein